MSDQPLDSASGAPGRARLALPFEVGVALVILILCLLYALLFSHMIYDSLMEQVFMVDPHPPRFAGAPHRHNAIEWVLIVVPALIGWAGTFGILWYLARRAGR